MRRKKTPPWELYREANIRSTLGEAQYSGPEEDDIESIEITILKLNNKSAWLYNWLKKYMPSWIPLGERKIYLSLANPSSARVEWAREFVRYMRSKKIEASFTVRRRPVDLLSFAVKEKEDGKTMLRGDSGKDS